MAQETASKAVSITVNTAAQAPCRAIFIGVAGNYDFHVDGGWVLFSGCTAGSVLPVRAIGARHADDSAPDAGDILFLY